MIQQCICNYLCINICRPYIAILYTCTVEPKRQNSSAWSWKFCAAAGHSYLYKHIAMFARSLSLIDLSNIHDIYRSKQLIIL